MSNQVSFDCTDDERKAVTRIVKRALKLQAKYGVRGNRMDAEMDLLATHANGNPMDFAKLEAADDFNLMHDVGGIARHLNRETGKLGNFFSPRCSLRERIAA